MSSKTNRTLLTAAAAFLLLSGCGGEESARDQEESAARPAPAAQPKSETAPKSDTAAQTRTLPKFKGPNTIVEKMDPDGKGMHLTATSPEGKTFTASIGEEIDMPEEFPSDVPIFPGSTPMASMSSPDEGMIVTFKSSEEQQDIFDFYQSNLERDGWQILDDQKLGGQLSFDAVKNDRKVSVVVAGTKGDARVSVIVTPEN